MLNFTIDTKTSGLKYYNLYLNSSPENIIIIPEQKIANICKNKKNHITLISFDYKKIIGTIIYSELIELFNSLQSIQEHMITESFHIISYINNKKKICNGQLFNIDIYENMFKVAYFHETNDFIKNTYNILYTEEEKKEISIFYLKKFIDYVNDKKMPKLYGLWNKESEIERLTLIELIKNFNGFTQDVIKNYPDGLLGN